MTIEQPQERLGDRTASTPVVKILSDNDEEAIHVSINQEDVPVVCSGRAMRVPEDSLLGWFWDHLLKGMGLGPSRC